MVFVTKQVGDKASCEDDQPVVSEKREDFVEEHGYE